MIHGRAVRLVIAVGAAVTFTSASLPVMEPLYARHVGSPLLPDSPA